MIHNENERLHARLENLTRQMSEVLGRSNENALYAELMILKEQMAGLQQTLFGVSSEKRPIETDAPSTESSGADDKADAPAKDQQSPKPKRQFDLPSMEQFHSLAEADLECDDCGGQLASWDGQFEEFEEVDVVERVYQLVTHRRQKYRCACGCAPVTAPGPVRLRGSRFSLLLSNPGRDSRFASQRLMWLPENILGSAAPFSDKFSSA